MLLVSEVKMAAAGKTKVGALYKQSSNALVAAAEVKSKSKSKSNQITARNVLK